MVERLSIARLGARGDGVADTPAGTLYVPYTLPGEIAEVDQWPGHTDRRHLIKPGITGWAALRCGYAGSNAGSAWKLCHDLYYIEHRSVGFDLLILAETAAELLTGRGVTHEQAGQPGREASPDHDDAAPLPRLGVEVEQVPHVADRVAH